MNTSLIRWLALSIAGITLVRLVAQTPPAPETRRADGASPLPGPLAAIHAHLCGFHFYGGDPQRALRVEHYCSHAGAGVMQCVIYDSAGRDARLIGVEYIISEARFAELPADEKKLWHSHRYEVLSGQLVAPDISAAAEQALMGDLVNTYGKTWNLWQVDRGDALPLGLPKLMMGFTADGQADAALVARRDRELKIDGAARRQSRAVLPARPVAAGADAWQSGPAFQIRDDWLVAPVSPQP